MTSSPQSGHDEEKAALRHHIEELEQAAGRADWEANRLAASSLATDQERLEAALQQEQLQARIRQLEVCLLISGMLSISTQNKLVSP